MRPLAVVASAFISIRHNHLRHKNESRSVKQEVIMISKNRVLSLVVISVAFALGYITFQAVNILNSWLIETKADCREHREAGNCPESRDGSFSLDVPEH